MCMALEIVDQALAAKRAFDDAVVKFGVAGLALKQWSSPDLLRVLENAHDDVLRAEKLAMELHREAYKHPTSQGVLHEACVQAGVTPPRSSFPDENDQWEEDTARSIPPHVRKEGLSLVRAARRFAESDRMFSAVRVLDHLRRFIDENQ